MTVTNTAWRKQVEEFYKELKEIEQFNNFNGMISTHHQDGINYAQIAIKNLILINAGALVALPALVQAFEISMSAYVIAASISFSLGITLMIICLLCSYFSAINAKFSVEHEKIRSYSSYIAIHLGNTYGADFIREQKEHQENHAKEKSDAIDRACRWELAAIIIGVLSLFAFCAGSTCFLLSALNTGKNVKIESSAIEK